MTLILSIATPQFVAHVSDRRLTLEKNKQFTTLDDDTNKLVVYANSIVFGYTGLACIDRKQSERTDWWLTKKLSELPTKLLSDAVVHVRDQATEAFQRLHYPADKKRHAFVGVGWQEQDDESVLPIMVRISNFHGEQGEILPAARDTFSAYAEVYESPGFGLCSTGANINPAQWADLRRLVNRCAKKGTGPNPIIRHFAMTIRKIAAGNPTVGKNLLAVAMPKDVAKEDYTAVFSPNGFGVVAGIPEGPPPFPPGGPGSHRSITSFYLPEDSKMYDWGVSVAHPGVAIDAVQSGPMPILMGKLKQSGHGPITTHTVRL